jgi:hypothetical protein
MHKYHFEIYSILLLTCMVAMAVKAVCKDYCRDFGCDLNPYARYLFNELSKH